MSYPNELVLSSPYDADIDAALAGIDDNSILQLGSAGQAAIDYAADELGAPRRAFHARFKNRARQAIQNRTAAAVPAAFRQTQPIRPMQPAFQPQRQEVLQQGPREAPNSFMKFVWSKGNDSAADTGLIVDSTTNTMPLLSLNGQAVPGSPSYSALAQSAIYTDVELSNQKDDLANTLSFNNIALILEMSANSLLSDAVLHDLWNRAYIQVYLRRGEVSRKMFLHGLPTASLRQDTTQSNRQALYTVVDPQKSAFHQLLEMPKGANANVVMHVPASVTAAFNASVASGSRLSVGVLYLGATQQRN